MASGVLVDTFDAESRASSPALSSDNDAVNTSTSRVYFGPVQSAERRHALARESSQPTPIRRSTRRRAESSSLALQILPNDEGEAGSSNEVTMSDQSRADTPILVDDAFEEPSSALASKVLRAWDNPSPPPSPPLSPRNAQTEDDTQLESDKEMPFLLLDVEPDPQSAAQDIPEVVMSSPQADTPIQDALPPSIVVDGGEQDTGGGEVDLINFDSSITQPEPPAPVVQLMPATPPRPGEGTRFTVDDLLAPSPARPLTVTSQEIAPSSIQATGDTLLVPSDSLGREGTTSGDEEAQVLIVLSDESQEMSRSSSPPAAVLAEAMDLSAAESSLQPQPELQTPLRRSTRPRRSVSPYFQPLTATPSKASEVALPVSPSPTKIEVGPARPRRPKDKQRDASMPADSEPSNDLNMVDGAAAAGSSLEPRDAAAENESGPHTPVPKGKGRAKPTSSFHQQLPSLSPTSANLLLQLLPSPAEPGPPVEDSVQPQVAQQDVLATTPPRDSGPTQQASLDLAAPSTPVRHDTSAQIRDIGRTPARRVPISEAIAQGTVSPVKAPVFFAPSSQGATGSSSFPHAPVFKARGADEAMRSPAKRVPVSDAMVSLQSPAKPSRPPPSTKSTHARSLSEDPLQPAASKPQRSMSAEPSRPSALRPTTLFKKPISQSSSIRPLQTRTDPSSSNAPFTIPPSIQETDEVEPQPQRQASTSKPSGIRPPAPAIRPGSKIPRPGTKPYTRPTAASTASQLPKPASSVSKKPVPNAPAPPAGRPMRMVRKVISKPVEVSSGSDDNGPQPVPGPGPRTVANRTVKPPQVSTSDKNTPTLKRKRELDAPAASVASPPGVRPVVLIRKVPPAPKPSPSPRGTARASPAKSPGPILVQGKIRMRKVVDKKKAKSPPRSPPRSDPMDIVHSPPPSAAAPLDQAPAASSQQSTNPPSTTIPSPPSPPVVEMTVSEPEPTALTTQVVPERTTASFNPDIAIDSEPESSAQGLRRTTRARKPAQTTTDVFGAVAPPRGSQSRRRTLLPDGSVFSGMSALALKSLTTTNTQRNQRQVAEIQTEVVIKEGKRPDSPTTKVRTALERQREERNRQREDRAARRARRLADADNEGDLSALGDLSIMSVEQDEQGITLTHRRGPGDEEDYETPERPERPAKRTRMEDGDATEAKAERRVKWDRGLSTTVILPDALPEPRRPPPDVVAKRGCLAPSAKKLALDSLGNVLGIDTPLPDVRPENVVVKKFVYEDDEPPAPEPPPEPQPKPTRSKSKKSRT